MQNEESNQETISEQNYKQMDRAEVRLSRNLNNSFWGGLLITQAFT